MNWTWKEIATTGLLLIARIHRITGEAEGLTPGGGWVPYGNDESTD